MKSRKSINDLPGEVIKHIGNYMNQQNCECLCNTNKNLFTKFGGTFFANSDKINIGTYLANKKNETDDMYKEIISAAGEGCKKYLMTFPGSYDDDRGIRTTKGTNRALYFLNIFRECSINFSIFSLFSLLNEENGKNLKNSVLSSIKNLLVENGLNGKLMPNIKKYILNKYIFEEDILYESMKILIEYIHSKKEDGSSFHADTRYSDVIRNIMKLEQELLLMPNNFVSESSCMVM